MQVFHHIQVQFLQNLSSRFSIFWTFKQAEIYWNQITRPREICDKQKAIILSSITEESSRCECQNWSKKSCPENNDAEH